MTLFLMLTGWLIASMALGVVMGKSIARADEEEGL